MIHPRLAALFPAPVVERARAYVAADRLRVLEIGPEHVVAVVRGTSTYETTITVAASVVTLSCSCAAAAGRGACKHQWALLLRLDEDEALPAALRADAPPPSVTFEAAAPVNDAYLEALAQQDGGAVLELGAPPAVEPWRAALRQIAGAQAQRELSASRQTARSIPTDRRIVYLVHLTGAQQADGVRVDVATQRRNRDGVWDAPRHFGFAAAAWVDAPDPADRLIANLLLGTSDTTPDAAMPANGFVIPLRAFPTTLRLLCETGRSMVRSLKPSLEGRVLRWDDGAPYTVQLRVTTSAAPTSASHYALTASLVRDRQEHALHDVDVLTPSGLMLKGDALARVESGVLQPLLALLWREGELDLGDDPSAFLEQYHGTPGLPALALPDGTVHTEFDVTPARYLTARADAPWSRRPFTRLAVRFRYGNAFADAHSSTPWVFDGTTRTLYRRRLSLEREAVTKVRAAGAQELYFPAEHRMGLALPGPQAPTVLAALVHDGWHVEYEGQPLVAAGPVTVTGRTGVDWFDLEGHVTFGSHVVPLMEVLAARASGATQLPLPDGAIGVLPRESLNAWQALQAFGERRGGVVRFKRGQLALVDILLESLPAVDVDAQLAEARTKLRTFRTIGTVPVPATFVGALRGYQHEALGWFAFLRQFGLGGCLADDMGLGKTVQVLALLEARRVERAGLSLLVVPRSLVFNWMQEAARFTPRLRVVDLSHGDRTDVALDALDADVVITTYGTLRRDVVQLGQKRFDYVVLDEAQAIKNAGTATAKAARVLQADHRLALTGTPIENRIEELWSLFEFLNPGMLGASSKFSSAARLLGPATAAAGVWSTPEAPDDLLTRALRPVILRRTKAQVAAELPARIEQTLEVELEPEQRAFYEAVRVRYAEQLFDLVDREGMARSRMHILEGLLRLRQAACHPVLVDASGTTLPSAKLDALIPSLQELTAEGHKALVFSQFTSFLALVKTRLDEAGVRYEYLDGRTRDRGARVARFQSAEGAPVFLISLKAGGHGLNLTAAEYVYLLDPWWNPAVEAQAIDRAHRIGQLRHVLATRVVARDTIESKILELQASKRALADAILGEDKGGLGAIGRAELELLFG
ncbi:DEAD/DEAH box helicase [Gemmatimonas sp.]|uniref:DEAD/DEAH box helicase n=1 Tax=Gemmatimonas sp. TaxID=1962908 RepID=UPI0025C14BF4|nr:DEAD/DEAH box helicase [Gemmatimonas sp.]MCA2990293.1 DEAD/DEAH box helicase [Gemmatimonas sp.]